MLPEGLLSSALSGCGEVTTGRVGAGALGFDLVLDRGFCTSGGGGDWGITGADAMTRFCSYKDVKRGEYEYKTTCLDFLILFQVTSLQSRQGVLQILVVRCRRFFKVLLYPLSSTILSFFNSRERLYDINREG